MPIDSLFSPSHYDYELPQSLIAQNPVSPRDGSRLMVVDVGSGMIRHHVFNEICAMIGSGDVVVANNSRVVAARFFGHRVLDGGEPGGKVEFLLLEQVEPLVWEGMFHAAVKHKPGVRFEIPATVSGGPALVGEIVRGASASEFGTVLVRFNRDPAESGLGLVPLPPYIRRHATPLEDDFAKYQTVYARDPGSSAAPTAGLHFTPELLEQLKARGVEWDEITLHVGLGTFRPVKSEDIRDHHMHEERYWISPDVAERVTAAQGVGKKIVAVGTTSLRALESAWDAEARSIRAGQGRTSLFIHGDDHHFSVVDGLITNFHLPRSTLLMLVCAFGGHDLVMRAYHEAVEQKYRFFSYGDAMFIK